MEYDVMIAQNLLLFALIVIYDGVPKRKWLPAATIYAVAVFSLSQRLVPDMVINMLPVRNNITNPR